MAFDGHFKTHLRSYVLGYEGNFHVRPKAELALEVSRKVESVKGNATAMDLVEILASVFAYWSLLSTVGSSSSTAGGGKTRRQVVVMEPHVIQLLAIFVLLKLDKPTTTKSWTHVISNSIGKVMGATTAGRASFELDMTGHLIQVYF